MHYPSVHWSEGMFLRPQHFQAADRYWSELLATSQQWDSHYNYGLRHIEISRDALANYQVQVTECEARLRDGSILSLSAGQAPDRISLKEAFQKATSVMVYLGVPKLTLGRPNVAAGSTNGELLRYVGSSMAVPDESTGGSDQEIGFRHAHARLLLSDVEGFETIPIARVKRIGQEEAVPELDEDYIPPLIAVDAWEPLSIRIVRRLYDILGRNIESVSQRVVQRGMNLTSQTPGDLEDLLRLMVYNQAHGYLHCTTFAGGVHPFVMYRELCRVVGMLAIFGKERRITDIPAYDHDDLQVHL